MTSNGSAIGSTARRPGRTFSADVTAPGSAREGYAAFRQEWDTQVGEELPLQDLDIDNSVDFRISVQAVKAHDVVIADFHNESYVGQTTGKGDAGERVLIHLMAHGAWRFGRPDGRGETVLVDAGSFIARHEGPPASFDVDPGARAKVLNLPAPALLPLLGGRQILGSVGSAEMRVLMAHANTVAETAADLSPAGARSAGEALIELARGALRQEFDDVEPRLAPALARAAMELADRHLADPELSPSALASELNVSLRTLHRAFASVGDSVAAYIRRRRLEQARLELAAPIGRPTVAEVAARWQFADSSHFVRAFRARYKETPTHFIRSSGTGKGRGGGRGTAE
ncbi:helix-turn-helix domain-containing protein [Streptomyces sp. NPDC002701]|uniref:helix-turn-helix domain-containing protein n=1 Tax=Streptomyces sp. NPDC002701 TaxID=3364661 RepID=UPI0036D04E89